MATREGHGEPIFRLMAVQDQIRRLEQEKGMLVDEAQASGHTWREIAAALGVRRQSAWAAYQRSRKRIQVDQARSALTPEQATAIADRAVAQVRAARRARR
jgi:hypothetical protein